MGRIWLRWILKEVGEGSLYELPSMASVWLCADRPTYVYVDLKFGKVSFMCFET